MSECKTHTLYVCERQEGGRGGGSPYTPLEQPQGQISELPMCIVYIGTYRHTYLRMLCTYVHSFVYNILYI